MIYSGYHYAKSSQPSGLSTSVNDNGCIFTVKLNLLFKLKLHNLNVLIDIYNILFHSAAIVKQTESVNFAFRGVFYISKQG